jgi:hypothetical protein
VVTDGGSRDSRELDDAIRSYDGATEGEKRELYLTLLDELRPNPWRHLERMTAMLLLVLIVALVIAVSGEVPTELVWVAIGVIATLAGVDVGSRLLGGRR